MLNPFLKHNDKNEGYPKRFVFLQGGWSEGLHTLGVSKFWFKTFPGMEVLSKGHLRDRVILTTTMRDYYDYSTTTIDTATTTNTTATTISERVSK